MRAHLYPTILVLDKENKTPQQPRITSWSTMTFAGPAKRSCAKEEFVFEMVRSVGRQSQVTSTLYLKK
jgi:hypothetical protein